ncbi:13460_t:CDS:2 [Dentiscutata erythropus]|uniref:13460_t:CDS:1 n=1 Tax=Dentiscutata erythropus TaxID=1348616 RepID=A0A9N8VPP9_9GLOM|nr:13460_t:CDS:2 [Dentiscutata erythropus]
MKFLCFISFGLLLFASISLSNTNLQTIKYLDTVKYWCGKPYIPKNQLIKNAKQLKISINQCSEEERFDSTNQNESNYTGIFPSETPSTIKFPPTNDPVPLVPDLSDGYTAMFRYQPYLSTDLVGSLIVTITNAISTISVKALLHDGSEILEKTKIKNDGDSIELPFSLAKIKPKLKAYEVKILFYNEDLLVHITYTKLYLLPVGQKTVKIDRLYGGILTSTNETIFPVGPYVDIGGWLEKGNIQINLQILKDQNFNIINPDPPYPNISFIHQMFQAADAIGGIYIQYSFRHDYVDIQKVINQVNQFKNYSSLLTWYIADEPDGEKWTTSSAVFEAYEAIKSVDPYHPVSLTLNCKYSSAFYADATDILGTDVYPVGVDMSHCTEYSDVCGCDDCIGSVSLDIPKRTQQYVRDLTLIGRESNLKWMVLQAFYDRNSWWERAPTSQEIRVMWYISIIYGYKSLMFWRFPFFLDHSVIDQIIDLSKEIKDLSNYILFMPQLSISHIIVSPANDVYVGVWMAKNKPEFLLIVVNGNDKLSVTFRITIKDLYCFGSLHGIGRIDDEKNVEVIIKDGVFEGNLNKYGVGTFIFKKDLANRAHINCHE